MTQRVLHPRTIRPDRGQPVPGTSRLHAQEQQQRDQEHEVRRQPGHTAQQRRQHPRQLAQVQRTRHLPQLLRAHADRGQLRGQRAHQPVRLRRVLRQLRRQPRHREDDPQRQPQQDGVHQQDHHRGRRPPRPSMSSQPALHRRNRDNDDQRHERRTDQPRHRLDTRQHHDQSGRADEDDQGARQAGAGDRVSRSQRSGRSGRRGRGVSCRSRHATTLGPEPEPSVTRSGRIRSSYGVAARSPSGSPRVGEDPGRSDVLSAHAPVERRHHAGQRWSGDDERGGTPARGGTSDTGTSVSNLLPVERSCITLLG